MTSDWDANATTFTWTANGQLATRTDPNGISYAITHDVNGRTISMTAGTREPPLLDVGYGYDVAGQLTSRSVSRSAAIATSKTYGYDPFGALSTVELPGETITYTSDAAGTRQTRTDSAGTRGFTWDVNSALPRLLDDGEHRFLYGASIVPIAQHDGTATEYLYGDLLGFTLLVADDAGAATSAYAYSEYGEVTGHTGASATAIGYSGNWNDPATGLLYLRARDYDPTTGQFLRVDPLVAQTLEPYAYADNSPLDTGDPSGMAPRGSNQQLAKSRHGIAPANPSCATKAAPVDYFVNAFVYSLGLMRVTASASIYALAHAARFVNDTSLSFAREFPVVIAGLNAVNGSSFAGTVAGAIASMAGPDGLRLPQLAGVKDGVLLWETSVGGGVMTIGNNMIVAGSSAERLTENTDLWKHECNHSVQWAALGPATFLEVWAGGALISAAIGQIGPGGGGCLNLIEWSAGAQGTTYDGHARENGCTWLA